MARIEEFERIDDLVGNGAWVGHLPNTPPDFAVRVRPNWNDDALRMLAEAKTSVDEATWKDDAFQNELDLKVLTEAILVDWAGVEDADGKPIPYDAKKARKILARPKAKSMRQAINYAARTVQQTGKDTVEDALKN